MSATSGCKDKEVCGKKLVPLLYCTTLERNNVFAD